MTTLTQSARFDLWFQIYLTLLERYGAGGRAEAEADAAFQFAEEKWRDMQGGQP